MFSIDKDKDRARRVGTRITLAAGALLLTGCHLLPPIPPIHGVGIPGDRHQQGTVLLPGNNVPTMPPSVEEAAVAAGAVQIAAAQVAQDFESQSR